MKNTSRMLDLIHRSLTGPIVEEEQFNNKHVTEGIYRVIKEYEIKLDGEIIINQNDELADRVWAAAIDFLSSCGVYSQSTGRVILYSEDEILSALKDAPAQVLLGRGTDSCLEVARKVEDPRVPLNMGAPIGASVPEEIFVPVMQSYIQEPNVDVTCPASLETVFGQDIRTGGPLEVLAAWREVDLMRLALNNAGRPGMAWTGIVISISDVGQLSALNPSGLLDSDMHTFGLISELKINNDILNKLAHSIRMGGIVDPYANPIFGGLCGGTEGLAVITTAEMIALSVFCMAACNGSSPTHPFHFNNTGPEIMRATSLAFQALARNSHLMTNLTTTPVGGPGTKTLLYECVAFSTMSTVSGISRMLGPRSATGSGAGHFSGLEARFNGEIMKAAARLDRGQAEEIVQKALEKYLHDLDKRPYGKPFPEVYDLKTVQPTKEWLTMYSEVKEEALSWGLPLE
jgi:methylamine--corrinoid protein Co-methyltransferase